MKQLETPRLILRGFVMEDLDDFYSYCSDPDVGIHGGREAHQDREQSAEELRKRISEDKTWAICKRKAGKILAWSGWNRIFAGNEVLTDAGCWDTCWQNRSGDRG